MITYTKEGAEAYNTTGDLCLDLFSKIGSMFDKRKSFYGDEESIEGLLGRAYNQDRETTLKILFWMRDCRGGAGNRETFRKCIKFISSIDPKVVEWNLDLIPKYGRWDDLRCLFNTSFGDVVASKWADAIRNNDVLAAKWADRNDYMVRNVLGMKIGDFRRMLANIRKGHIVEYKMCSGKWSEINYSTVPSVAMARYTNAFGKNDPNGFEKFKADLISPTSGVKIHAETLFPHDCVRTAMNGDGGIADAQFDALPNMMEESREQVMCICDTSGSMETEIFGSIKAMDVSMSLALYCSGKLPEESIFYKRFIAFGSEGRFVDWRDYSFTQAIKSRKIFNRSCESTRIDKALNTILEIATKNSIPQRLMPTMLLIVSDMQFSQNADGTDGIQGSLKRWIDSGYSIPKIVYWNTAGYKNSPWDMYDKYTLVKEVCLISGFSPSILKSVLSGKNITPVDIMMETLKKYEVVV